MSVNTKTRSILTIKSAPLLAPELSLKFFSNALY